ncbi:hypothetical protein TBLA_0I02180 [Henningerozyma blattae CBS 6284]|uniref:DUF2423 domain-containing protein n=1 Tax=Henningerozyma blattae (strain ATCC 34711 / CBS 6284 / DSM 70876 / NBRC 10599 / NRRL Y-10934 / UCD 77-7) TaxID=1071380 RepID=I2H924_HENB6|nr:hypothetical protein TBLA_0I02180 [Tetrapisispora blattae CBS 6284]CCH62876.1 hypothetical protein TBLA_0I02180 [Tetrapisispora blattae CBS 6284]
MAKSLRAKAPLKSKSVIRHEVFQKVVDCRASRISDKLKQDLIDQKLKELKSKNPDGMEVEINVDDLKKEETKVDYSKIKTSGWRASQYKKNKMARKTKKKGSFTRF